MVNPLAAKNAKSQQQTNKTIATKRLIVQEYKDRLKNNVKSLNDNFESILTSIKLIDDSHRANSTGKLADYYAMRNEATARASLMVKATDELQTLTNDIREFLILRDFNFISNSIEQAEEDFKRQQEDHEKEFNRFRTSLSSMVADIDRELAENTMFRH